MIRKASESQGGGTVGVGPVDLKQNSAKTKMSEKVRRFLHTMCEECRWWYSTMLVKFFSNKAPKKKN